MTLMKPLHWLHGEVKTPPMSAAARKELKMKDIGKGWVEGSAQEFLGLSDAEAAYVEAKLALTRAVRARRLAMGLSQASMAKALGTSQSRFSFIEKGDPSVSLDLTIRALFETGLDMKGVAALMTGKAAPRTPKALRTPKERRAAKTA